MLQILSVLFLVVVAFWLGMIVQWFRYRKMRRLVKQYRSMVRRFGLYEQQQ